MSPARRGIAVLDVMRDEGLVENARVTGDYFREGLRSLMQHHGLIGDVRGVGLATGVELVRDSGQPRAGRPGNHASAEPAA